MESIKQSISGSRPGSIIFPNDFRATGSQDAIKMALSRLVKSNQLKRIAHGIYYSPFIDPLLGEMMPSPEAVAQNLANRERVKIMPAGGFALNKLGFSTQVPTKLVYLTDGHPRKLKIGNATIEFKATTPKKMAMVGKLSSLLILALEELDLEHIPDNIKIRIKHILQVEERGDLLNDMRLAPARIYNYLVRLLKELDDDSIFSLINQPECQAGFP